MMILWLLAGLVVSGAGICVARRWRRPGQALIAVGGIGLIGVVALEVRQNVFPPQPGSPHRCEMAVSYRLANCVMGDLTDAGGNVVLLFPERRLMDADTEQGYEDGLVVSLRHSRARPHLKAVRLGAANDAAHGLSAFKQALGQAQDAAAIVSFAGVPAGFENLFSNGQPGVPPFYVFDGERTTNWLGALKAGHIKAVALPRPGADTRSRDAAVGMPEAIFERFFVLATQATADDVAASLKNAH